MSAVEELAGRVPAIEGRITTIEGRIGRIERLLLEIQLEARRDSRAAKEKLDAILLRLIAAPTG
jgi:hypothetical protein